jgi:hypothetical protein
VSLPLSYSLVVVKSFAMKINWHSKYWNLGLATACIIGLLMNILSFRTALRQEDHFSVFISLGWIIIFTVSGTRNILVFRRKTQRQEEVY